jgi:pyridoxal phosphate enzyme (YggS family)
LGIRDVGDNKVQEAIAKRSAIEDAHFTHHFIGHLQTNKARRAVELFDVIQSIDRPNLAQDVNRIAGELGKKQRCLVEVKVSDEATKGGVPLSQAEEFITGFSVYTNLKLEGLMTMAPYDASEEKTRRCFQALKKLADKVRGALGEKPTLSFGMSDDFELAVQEGSTMVRIGRALFGERK